MLDHDVYYVSGKDIQKVTNVFKVHLKVNCIYSFVLGRTQILLQFYMTRQIFGESAVSAVGFCVKLCLSTVFRLFEKVMSHVV